MATAPKLATGRPGRYSTASARCGTCWRSPWTRPPEVSRRPAEANSSDVPQRRSSADLPRMLAARSVPTNPIDRHFLLQGIVQHTYRRRRDPQMRRLCIDTGMMHLKEFAGIAPVLSEDCGGSLPCVPSLAWLATVLAEEGMVDEAIQVCESAARLGLDDGTKGGYLGRAQRLAKKKSRGGRDP